MSLGERPPRRRLGPVPRAGRAVAGGHRRACVRAPASPGAGKGLSLRKTHRTALSVGSRDDDRDVVAEADAIARSVGGSPCEFSPMDHAFAPVGTLSDNAEGKQLADSPAQPLPHHDALGERLDGVRLRGSQRKPAFPVPWVELEEHARDALSDLNDLRNVFEGPPGELREGDEPDAGEEWGSGPSSNATDTPKGSTAATVPVRRPPCSEPRNSRSSAFSGGSITPPGLPSGRGDAALPCRTRSAPTFETGGGRRPRCPWVGCGRAGCRPTPGGTSPVRRRDRRRTYATDGSGCAASGLPQPSALPPRC